MCLLIDSKLTKDFLQKKRNKYLDNPLNKIKWFADFKFDVYKTVRIDECGLISTSFRKTPIYLGQEFVAVGEIDINSNPTQGMVLEGGVIHTWPDIESCNWQYNSQVYSNMEYQSQLKILKCTAKIKDLIAMGYFDTFDQPVSMAFKKVFPVEIIEFSK